MDLSESGDPPKGHKAKVSMDSSEDDDGALLANGSLVASGMSANWIVDSGATSHVLETCLCHIGSSKNQRR